VNSLIKISGIAPSLPIAKIMLPAVYNFQDEKQKQVATSCTYALSAPNVAICSCLNLEHKTS